MEQLSFLEPTPVELQMRIADLEGSLDKMRKASFAKMDAMGKDYLFLYDNLEVVKDLVEWLKKRDGYELLHG